MFCTLLLGFFEKLNAESDFAEDSTYVKAHKAAAGAKKGLNLQCNNCRQSHQKFY